ncbi:MAG TPA: FGGY family carbohydrate kinase, partial [Gemmatirosa sp.]
MTPPLTYLAIDLGASSGRGVLGTLDGDGRMAMREIHRFRTPLVEDGGHLWWDAEALWEEVRTALARALAAAPGLRAVSVDSWAVDYVPLGTDGVALRRPYAYRDPRTRGRLDEAIERVPGGADALYARTGIQFLPFNTLPQVVADLADEPALVARTAARLFIADYLLYRMTGRAVVERTMASTSQLLDVRSGAWADDLIRAIGDDPARWPEVVVPGTVLGVVRDDALPARRAAGPCAIGPSAIATCAHDTAAAIAAVPATGDRPWAYISSGTWSLVGAELVAPVLTPAARAAGFTNEAGLDGTVRFLKNRTGMWVLEECLRAWAAAGAAVDWQTLVAEAAASGPADGVVDLDA